MNKENDKSVMCCFCGEGLEYSHAVQLTIKPNSETDELQGVFCHPKCLDNVLLLSVPRHPDLLTNENK